MANLPSFDVTQLDKSRKSSPSLKKTLPLPEIERIIYRGAVVEGQTMSQSWALNPSSMGMGGFRTVFERCLWEVVLPAVTVLSMSLFTIVTIVLVVTTVAKAGIHF